MSRTNRRDAIKNREQIDPLDFKPLNEQPANTITDDTEIIVKDSKGTGGKTTLGVVLSPLTERVKDLEETITIDIHSAIYIIQGDEEYTIESNKQMLVKEELFLDGTLNINGQLFIEA